MAISKSAAWINYKLHCWKTDRLQDMYDRKWRKNLLWMVITFLIIIGIIITISIMYTPTTP